jgi:hypothetical protein
MLKKKTSPVVRDNDAGHVVADTTTALLDEPADITTLRVHPVTGPILNQTQLRQAITLTKLAHRTPGIQMWTGDPGVGKTVAAEQLTVECNAEADQRMPGCYRAHYFMTGGDVDHGSGRQMKRGIYTAYEELVDELSSGELRQRSEKSLAEEIVEVVRLTNTQLLVVDEAGTKTAAEIRGLALISDIARQHGFPFSVLLVGMDDLAAKMMSLAVLKSRKRLTHTFRSWDEAESLAWLLTRSASIRCHYEVKTRGIMFMIQTLFRETGYRLREIDTLVPEIEMRLAKRPDPAAVIRHILEWRQEEEEVAMAQSTAYTERRRRVPVPV